MWFFMWWWIVPFVLLFALRGRRRRWVHQRGWDERYVSDLRRMVEGQREYIDQLESRLSRVEEGLDFAERLLAERTGAAGHPAAHPAAAV
jgi:hypothetical protein